MRLLVCESSNYLLSCTVFEIWRIIGLIFVLDSTSLLLTCRSMNPDGEIWLQETRNIPVGLLYGVKHVSMS